MREPSETAAGSEGQQPARDPEAALRERVRLGAFHDWAGLRLVRVAAGEVEVAMEVDRRHLNPSGVVHGGVIASIADTAAGLAVRSAMPPGWLQTTAHLGVSYLAAGRPGRLVGRGRAVRVGRRTAYAEAEVLDARGTLLARATATLVLLPEG